MRRPATELRAGRDGVVVDDVLGANKQFELLQRGAGGAGAWQRHGGIGRHHPQRLDLAALDRVEHVDRFQARLGREPRRLPELADAVGVGCGKVHVRGELIGEPADFAAAHRVGLPGQRERSHAGPADASGGEVNIDDGVDLVGPLRRLIDALREAGDDALGLAEQFEEARDVGALQPGDAGGRGDVARDLAGAHQRLDEA